MADTYFVGLIGNPSATAAVGVCFPLMAVLQAVGFMFGHGSGNYISRALGAQDQENATRMASTGFFLALLCGVGITVLGIALLQPLVWVLGSTPTIAPFARGYAFYILLGSPWLVASLVLNNQIRFQGNAVFSMVDRGFDAVKIKVGVDGGHNPDEDLRRVAAVRELIGPNVRLMLDANNVWRASTAVQFANRVKEYNIELFEEPVFADDMPGLAQFKQGTDVPLATGEHEYTRYGVRDLLLNKAVDILQVDVTRCGGYTEILKIIGMTQAWNLGFAPHGMEHMHMHLASAFPNALYLERLFMFEEVVRNVYLNPPEPENGKLRLPDAPGLGMELNMDYIRDNAR